MLQVVLHLYSKFRQSIVAIPISFKNIIFLGLILSYSEVGFADPVDQSQSLYNQMKFREAEELLYRSIPNSKNSGEKSRMYLLLGVIKYQQNRKQSANQYFELALKLNSSLELKNIRHVDKGIYDFFSETKTTLFPKSLAKQNAPVPPQKSKEVKSKPKTILAPRLSSPAIAKKTPPKAKPIARKPPPIVAKTKVAPNVAKQNVAPKKTLLFVASPQIDAMISQDGIIIGKVNSALEVKAGQFQIEVNSPGFVTQRLLVDVKNQQTLTINVNLNKQQEPKLTTIAKANPRLKGSSKKVANKNSTLKNNSNRNMNLADSKQNKALAKNSSNKKAKSIDPFAEKPVKYQKPATKEPSIADEFNRDQQATQQVLQQGQVAPPVGYAPAPPNYPPQTPPYQTQQNPYGQQGQAPYAPQAPVQQPQGYGYQQMPPPAQSYPPPAPVYQPAPGYQAPQTYGAPPPPPVIIDQRSLPAGQSNQNLPNTGMQQATGSQKSVKSKTRVTSKAQKGLSGSDHFFNLMPFGIAQFRNKQIGLGVAFATGQFAALYYYFSMEQEITATTAETNEILAEREAEWNTLPTDQRDAHLAETEQFRNDRISYQNTLADQSMMGIYGFVGLWGLNVATSYLYPPKARRLGLLELDISDNVSLAFNPLTNPRMLTSGFKTDLHFKKMKWQEHNIHNFLSIETILSPHDRSNHPQIPVLMWKLESSL